LTKATLEVTNFPIPTGLEGEEVSVAIGEGVDVAVGAIVAVAVGANMAVGLDVALGVVVAKRRHPANTLVSAINLRKSRLEILRGRILPL